MPQVTVGVREEDDGTFTGYCAGNPADPCGKDTPYTTSGWPSRDDAADRIRQHKREHVTGELMQPLDEFLRDHGLAKSGDGRSVVSIPDDELVE